MLRGQSFSAQSEFLDMGASVASGYFAPNLVLTYSVARARRRQAFWPTWLKRSGHFNRRPTPGPRHATQPSIFSASGLRPGFQDDYAHVRGT